MLTMICCIS